MRAGDVARQGVDLGVAGPESRLSRQALTSARGGPTGINRTKAMTPVSAIRWPVTGGIFRTGTLG
jgi:hypothetical protein